MNGLLTLVLLACLADRPERCEEVNAGEYAMPVACAIAGPPLMAEYQRLHPARLVRRWRCEPAGRRPA